MRAYLHRRYRFSASHRLDNPAMSAQENRDCYGKCNNPHGHGHNYVAELSLAGEIDPQTGMVCNLADLDTFMHERVIDSMHESNLNDHELLRGEIPTTEALSKVLFEFVSSNFRKAELQRVRVEETGQNAFEYYAPNLPDNARHRF